MSFSLSELADVVNGKLKGDPDIRISQVGTSEHGVKGQISFVSESKYLSHLKSSSPSAVIAVEKNLTEIPNGIAVIIHENPYWAFAKISQKLNPMQCSFEGVHPSAHVDETAVIGKNVNIGPHVSIESHCVIGDGVTIKAGSVIEHNVSIASETWIGPNSTVCHDCIIGAKVMLQAGATIGSEGFGFANQNGKWERIPQIGKVIIGDGSNIGANTVIDRGAIEDTIIGEGVILDNLIQIAHNVKIGDNTAMAAMSAVAGSTTIGANCMIAGCSKITGHVSICDGVFTTADTFITKSITSPGAYSSGTPMDTTSNWRKNSARFRQLDSIAKRLKQLEKKQDD